MESEFQEFVGEVKRHLDARRVELTCHEYGRRPGRKYSLRAPKVFAWVHKKPRLGCLAVGTRQEWADKAGLHDYTFKTNTQFNGPGAHWRIAAGDRASLKKVAREIVLVREVRH